MNVCAFKDLTNFDVLPVPDLEGVRIVPLGIKQVNKHNTTPFIVADMDETMRQCPLVI